MSITALLRRAETPVAHLRRISQAVADLQPQPEAPPPVPSAHVETLLDAALNDRLSLIARGRARELGAGQPSLDAMLIDAIEAAIADH